MRKRFINSSMENIAGTLDGNYYKGQGLRQGIEREYIVVISELGRHADGTDIDSKQCRRKSENAGQREF